MGSPAKKTPSGPFADKLWREALRRAVLRRVEKQQRLDRIANVVVSAAEGGDIVAAKEIGDRLDGKATQTLNTTVERRMVAPAQKEASTSAWLDRHAPKSASIN